MTKALEPPFLNGLFLHDLLAPMEYVSHKNQSIQHQVWHWTDEIFQLKLFLLCLDFQGNERLVPKSIGHFLPMLKKFVRGEFQDMEFALKWRKFRESKEETNDQHYSEEKYEFLSDLPKMVQITQLQGKILTETARKSSLVRKNHITQYVELSE